MAKKKKLSKGFAERTTGTGEGVVIQRTGAPKQTEHTKHLVAVPKGHRITEEEAMEFGRALYDAIVAEQAKVARRDG